MKNSKLIPFIESAYLAVGEIICSAIIIGVFLLIGKFDYTVVLGCTLGSVIIIANFLAMAISVNRAIDNALLGYGGIAAKSDETSELQAAATDIDTEAKSCKKADIAEQESTLGNGSEASDFKTDENISESQSTENSETCEKESESIEDDGDGSENDEYLKYAAAQAAKVSNISKISYIIRTVSVLGALVLSLLSGHFNVFATVIPMFMFRPILMIKELFKRGVKKNGHIG